VNIGLGGARLDEPRGYRNRAAAGCDAWARNAAPSARTNSDLRFSPMPPPTAAFIDELKWRGLFHQCTSEDGLRAHLSGAKRRAYVGFDPTADSLTIGNLVPTMMLAHFQRCGHEPVVVMGGGTGMIGDPSGKSAERQLMTTEQVAANVEKQRVIFSRIWRGAGLGAEPAIVNNADWLGTLGYIEVLRDVGKHFSVNMMIQKDSVRERLNARDQGISYTEFSYMILQAYDFLHLFEKERVTLQMGGSDQWGNILGGCDLIRRHNEHKSLDAAPDGPVRGFVYPEEEHGRSFGLTAPLVTKADGGKFGKTESGAIWLTPERTSPYAYYQYWLNAADADVGKFLRLFTFLPRERIEELETAHAKDPGAREPHRALAREATAILHGPEEMEGAEKAAKALFSGDVAGLPARTFEEAMASAPHTSHDKASLSAGIALLDLLPQTSLAKSKSESREFLGSGSVSVNGQKAAADRKLTPADLLHGRYIALRRGKKSWHVTRWE
jgi:tyrosyl-tRNA synthetase